MSELAAPAHITHSPSALLARWRQRDVGALGLFVALGIEWTALLRLRGAATVEQAREWLGLFALVRRLGPASLVVVLLAGMYLAGTTWGFTP